MKKKGFTLIELIGVILLLGVIALITIPTVNVILKNNKEKALQQTIKTLEEAAYHYSNSNDIGYSSETKILQISSLKEAGLIKNETLINPTTDSELEGCVLYRWDDNYKQYTFTYDEECVVMDFEVEIVNKTGVFNEYGWANKDFYVDINTNGTSYNYCISDKECSPNARVEQSSGSVYVTKETEHLYICAYANYKKTSSAIVCNDLYKLDKTAPTAGTIEVTGEKGENDWYISTVDIKAIDGTDDLSGHLSTVVDKTSIDQNTAGEKVTVTTTDYAGNVSTRDYTIKVEIGNPTVTISKTVVDNKNVITATTNSMTSGFSYEWYKDGSVIQGANNSSYTTTESGTYKLKVTTGSGKTIESNEITINSYTITYNMNGGTGTIANQTKIEDLELTLSSVKPTLRGYTFIGWSTSSTATVETYKSGGIYTTNQNATLYAVYSVNSYICSAGNYLGSNAIECTKCEAGSYCPGGTYNYSSSIQGKSTCPSGYGSSATGSDAASDCYLTTTAGKYIATANSSTQTTCTAGSYCSSTNVYYGSYGASGGLTSCPSGYGSSATGSDAASDCYLTTTAGKYIATANSSSQTTCQSGYYCPSSTIYYGATGGRSTCPSGYGTSASGSDAASDCYKTITVSYSGNGSTSGSTSSSSCNAYYNSSSCSITLSASGFSKTNYTFQGWGTGTSSVSHNAGSSYSFSSNTTLNAIWKVNYICSTGELQYDSSKGYVCVTSGSSSYSCYSCTYDVTNYGQDSSCGYASCSVTSTTSPTPNTTYSCPSDYTSSGSGSSMTCSKTTTSTTSATSCTVNTTKSCDSSGYTLNSSGTMCYKFGGDPTGCDITTSGSCSSSNCPSSYPHADYWSGEYGCYAYSYSISTTYSCPSDCTSSGSGSSTKCYKCTSGTLSGTNCVSSVTSTTSPTPNTTYSCPSGYSSSGSGSSMTCSKTETKQDSSCGYTSCYYTTSTSGYNCSACGGYTYYYCPSGWSTYSGSGSSLKCYKSATTN